MARNVTVDRIKIKQFGCVKDVDLKLSPIHAFIGPNDSGKSTILRAIRTGMQLLTSNFSGGFPETKASNECRPFHPGIYENAEIEMALDTGLKYNVNISRNEIVTERLLLLNGAIVENKRTLFQLPSKITIFGEYHQSITKEKLHKADIPEDFGPNHKGWDAPSLRKKFDQFLNDLRKKNNANPSLFKQKPHMVRLDPDSLRIPGNLIPSTQQIEMDEKGIGLASIYDVLMNKNVDHFISIREQFKKLFPTVSTIGLKNININEGKNVSKILELELKTGQRISAQFMSEGMLYYLAFAVLKYLEPASIILVEEPENGLHPSRIKDIMIILREISETTQILIATHSPLVINELKEDEVSVVWRDDEKGTMVMPIRETKNFAERSKVYALGELWLSYANGVDEKPLREGVKEK